MKFLDGRIRDDDHERGAVAPEGRAGDGMTALRKRVQRLERPLLECGPRAALAVAPFPPADESLADWAAQIRADLGIFDGLLLIQRGDQPTMLTKFASVADMDSADFELICSVADRPTILIDTASTDCPAIHLPLGLTEAALTGMSREMHNE